MNEQTLNTTSHLPPDPQARPVLLDTDMSPDSWLAVLFLLQHPRADVKAITVSGTGESHSAPGARNARRLTALAGQPEIPVAGGRTTPLRGNHSFPKLMRWLMDRMLGLCPPDNPYPAPQQTAVELLTSVIQNSPQKVTLIAVGPLTNVAEALQAQPSLADKLHMIYCMSGAIDVPGNIREIRMWSRNTTAEWNTYCDPHAANLVFRSGAPITLVPLDATNPIPTTRAFCKRLQADCTTPAAKFAAKLLGRLKRLIPTDRCILWDPMTAAIAVDEGLGTFQQRTIRVIEKEGPESGRMLSSADGANVRVCTSIDGGRFEQLFLDTLNGRTI